MDSKDIKAAIVWANEIKGKLDGGVGGNKVACTIWPWGYDFSSFIALIEAAKLGLAYQERIDASNFTQPYTGYGGME